MSHWRIIPKTFSAAVSIADRHYTRQTPGSDMYTRPGYNQCLWCPDGAVWAWFRPAWEKGIERKDRLRTIECTMFRNESAILSSELIIEAEWALLQWEHFNDCVIEDVITAVNSKKTKKRRGKSRPAGYCFIAAGWTQYDRPPTTNADTWLRKPIEELTIAPPHVV